MLASMIKQATPQNIRHAASLLQRGEIVAFPTETVFGMGADAANESAVEKLFAAKNRPRDKALSVMVHDIAAAEKLALFDQRALTLAHTLWPGPLSLVLPRRPGNGISEIVTAGQETISLRLPRHPVALALLKEAGCPIAAPSANPSGNLSTTTALEVARHLGDAVPLILADAAPVIGIESTLLDLTRLPAVILRPGAIALEEISGLIGDVVYAENTAPGLTLKTPLRLRAIDVGPGEAFLGFGKVTYIGVQGVGFVRDMPEELYRNLSPDGDLHEAAAHLYKMLQELDECGATAIAIMNIPNQGLGQAINARLAQVRHTTLL